MSAPLRVRLRNAGTADLDEQILEVDEPIVLGRSRDADVLLAHPGVSRRHASLRPVENTWMVEDLHSTRGTYVNGRRLDPGESARVVVGDLIEINPWSVLILGNHETTGVLLDDSMVEGTIVEAIASPMLQQRFDGLLEAVQRTAGRAGDEEVFAAMLESLLAGSDLDRAMVLRVEPEETRAISIRARDRADEEQPRAFSRTLVTAALARDATIRMEEQPDVTGTDSLAIAGVREAMCRRFAEDGDSWLVLYGDRVETVGEDQDLVAWFDAIADLCRVALRMQRGRRAENERERLAAEMNAARAVQEMLLPEANGDLGGLSWSSLSIPGLEVAGDLVDVRPREDSLYVMFGDVSGKGARAGLIMAGAQACAEALFEEGMSPLEVIQRLDHWAIRNTPDGCFITLWCGRIDPDGTVTYVDAGHGLLLVRRADGTIEWDEEGRRPPIGIEDLPTQECTVRLERGDEIIIFSDGLVEEPARDSDDRYGLERVEASVVRHGGVPLKIHADLVEWCGREQFDDDLTVLVVRRHG